MCIYVYWYRCVHWVFIQILGQQINDFTLPDVNLIGEHADAAELGRMLQLILGCAVNCEQKQGTEVWKCLLPDTEWKSSSSCNHLGENDIPQTAIRDTLILILSNITLFCLSDNFCFEFRWLCVLKLWSRFCSPHTYFQVLFVELKRNSKTENSWSVSERQFWFSCVTSCLSDLHS